MRLLIGDDANVAKWVADRIPFVAGIGFGPCKAIGIVGASGPLAGIVFHDWQPGFRTIAFSVASTSPKWATKRLIGSILAYPFLEVGVQKLWTATPHTNERALRLAKGLGFTREGTLSHHFGKDHAVINRMFHRDFLRLYGEQCGQTIGTYAA